MGKLISTMMVVAVLGTGCAPGGGGGGGRPLVTELQGFGQWFEVRDDGAWPKCDGAEVETLDFDDDLTRVCAGTDQFARTLKETGVVYQWRYDTGAGPQVAALGDASTGEALYREEYQPCDGAPDGVCDVEGQVAYCAAAVCWTDAGCAQVNSACAGVVERMDAEGQG